MEPTISAHEGKDRMKDHSFNDDMKKSLELMEEAREIATPHMESSKIAQTIYWRVGGITSALRMILDEDSPEWADDGFCERQ